MRLTCPNCGAQYEIAEGLIPDQGRDVQCSSCAHVWFEHNGRGPAEPAQTAPTPSEPEDWVETPEETAEPPAPSTMSTQVSDLLREEAEASRALREQEPDGLESQPELGLAPPTPQRVDHTADKPRKDMLPDIEAINSSLEAEAEAHAQTSNAQVPPKGLGLGFRWGFALVIVAALVAVLTYVFAPLITTVTPDTVDTILTDYVAWVDALRLRLDLGLQRLIQRS